MAAITTEEAARRLARVILSDVELYNRERPREGESLDAQYEEGRRLFASRVSPEMLSVFDAVLADRKSGKASGVTAVLPSAVTNGQGAAHGPMNGQTASSPPAVETVAAVTVAPVAVDVPATTIASPVAAVPPTVVDEAADFGNDEITATGSAEVKETLHDEPTRPTLMDDAPPEHAPIFADVTAPAPPAAIAAPPTRPATPVPLEKGSTPPPVLKVAAPAPASVSVAKAATPPPLPKVPTPPPLPLSVAPAAPVAAATLATDRAPTPPQPIPIAAVPLVEAPVPEIVARPPSGAVPTLKVGVSIPKILLVLAIGAGLVAVIAHFVRLSP